MAPRNTPISSSPSSPDPLRAPTEGSSGEGTSPSPALLPAEKGTGRGHIALRGVRVHNLKSIDLDIPHRKLIVLCGLSGSGKSSLALDTLYAEGQRRYIESFSAYTRQFLQRLEKPEAERIDGIPPAIAVTSKNTSRSSRSTVGTATETNDYLRLLMAKSGHVFCRQCGREVRCDSPQSAAETLAGLPPGSRYMIAFACPMPEGGTIGQLVAELREDGFVRAIVDGRLVNLDARGKDRGTVSLPPITVTGTEFGVNWSAHGARAVMLAKLLRIYQGKQYVSRELNVPIIVGRRGIKNVLAHLPDAKPAMALAKLPELLESAAWDRDEPPREPDQNIRTWHYLTSPVILAGERHLAEIKVREDGNGHWFYDQHLMLEKKEDSPYKPGTSAKDALPFSCGSTSAGESSPTGIIGRRNKEVKRGKRSFATAGKPAGADSAPSSPVPPLPPPSSTPLSIAWWPAAPPTAASAIRWKRPSPRGEAGAGRLSRRGQGSEVRRQSRARRSIRIINHQSSIPHSLSPLPSFRSTAGRGGGSALARNWLARIAASSIRRRSRGFIVSTAPWARVPNAKVLGTSSGWTWI